MDRADVLSGLKTHLAIMKRGADHAALALAIKEIEHLQRNKHPVIEGHKPHCRCYDCCKTAFDIATKNPVKDCIYGNEDCPVCPTKTSEP